MTLTFACSDGDTDPVDPGGNGNGGAEQNTAPALTITSPEDGDEFTVGEAVTIAGTASDAEEGDLSASIEWSCDIDGALGSGAAIDVSPDAGTHTVTATVTDSEGATDEATITFTVVAPAATPPDLVITSPSADTTIVEGEELTFAATATDAEDGDLSAAIEWISDADGELGQGASLTATLSTGDHVVSAAVEDSDGNRAEETIEVTVSQADGLAVVITSPADGTTSPSSGSVTFSATAWDPEDGDLSSTIVWTSSLDATLGNGPTVTADLSIGLHSVRATVVNGADAASDTIQVHVYSDGTRAYLTRSLERVYEFDLASRTIYPSAPATSLITGGIAVSPDGGRLYVTGRNGLAVVDIEPTTADRRVIETIAGPEEGAIAITPDGGTALISHRDGTLSVVATAAMQHLTTLSLRDESDRTAISITADGSTAYVLHAADSSISVLDIASLTVADTIHLDFEPTHLAVTPDGETAFLGIDRTYVLVDGEWENWDLVLPFDLSTSTVTDTIPVGSLGSLHVTSNGDRLIIAGSSPDRLQVLEIASGVLTEINGFGGFPRGLAVTPDGSRALVTLEGYLDRFHTGLGVVDLGAGVILDQVETTDLLGPQVFESVVFTPE